MTQSNQLSQASALIHLARTIVENENKIRRITGLDFTVFNVLGLHHYETWVHTPMLASLLDPKGIHGQGPVFLEMFIERIRKIDLPDNESLRGFGAFSAKTATVKMEYSLGEVTDTSGGNVDIYLYDSLGHEIMIENKIYAKDQLNQLYRYANSRTERRRSRWVIYLTLDGREPSDPRSKQTPHIRISYSTQILEWLDDCIAFSAAIPTLRETLLQYKLSVSKITLEPTSQSMTKELVQLITQSRENIEAYQAIVASEELMIKAASERLRQAIEEQRQRENGDWKGVVWHEDPPAYKLHNERLAALNLFAGFFWDKESLWYGFQRLDRDVKVEDDVERKLKELYVINLGPGEWNSGVNWGTWFEQYPKLNISNLTEVFYGDFASEVKSITAKLILIGNQLCEELKVGSRRG